MKAISFKTTKGKQFLMKQNRYLITFRTGVQIEIMAFNKKEAMILAQADQINKGHSYRIESVFNLDE